ncbi:protein translocase subunit SecD [Paenibacillus cisolokensis]|jgi:protein-export membrane protein, SecD/SecF family|uniref:protein translocase subunit SecD n=1 Tax=Paenibacillus TaxID=44249 RepID=UPI00071EC680|nr:protein translocase subunit SecD [Paenibacillus sp. 32O-W]ALS27026.1 subunit SecD of preprotein translocase [Paenibacillus sp. 32O-W]
MSGKRIIAFLGVVVVLFGAIVWTSPDFVRGVRLGLDLKGGFEILYEASPIEGGQQVTPESLRETAKSLESRVDALGIAEPEITTEGSNRIRVKLAGVTNEEEVREIIKKPVNLTFRAPDGTIELKGSDFVENGARVEYDQVGNPLVTIKLKDAKKFEDVTTRLTGQTLSIYLDDELLSSPVVNYPITGGSAQISGDYTLEEARKLRDTINLGALPLKLTEKYTQSVGATLGQQSLEKTVQAGIIGTLIILVFLVILYRLPGVVACISLITYTWLLIIVYNLMNATLTLPGIAAFVLGIGMAVDANIITAERIKEEIRSGKSLLSSLKAGSKSSFRTIMDANVTSIISSLVLYYIGNGAIRGFALTMILSILLSVLTNVFFSRFLIHLLVKSNVFTKPFYYGVKEAEIREL